MTFEGLKCGKTVVLFAVGTNDFVLIPYYQTPQRGLLGAHVIRDTVSYSAITNTQITADVYYFEFSQHSVSPTSGKFKQINNNVGDIYYSKINDILFITIINCYVTSGYTTLCTLPQDCRPEGQVVFAIADNVNANYSHQRYCIVESDGAVKVRANSSGEYIWATATIMLNFPAQYSVSPKLLAETQSTSYTSFAVDLSTAKMLILMCCTKENRPLASTTLLTYEFINICKSNETSAQCCFGAEPANYTCNAYYANGSVYLKTQSSWDKVRLFRLQ